MKRTLFFGTLLLIGLVSLAFAERPPTTPAFPHFRVQQIETGLKIGYCVLLVDMNGDGKKDIVVADARRVVWYENPTWQRHTVIGAVVKHDNVSIAAYDINGDGRLDVALAAGWRNLNPSEVGTLQWLEHPAKADEPFAVHPIGTEHIIHRIRFADIYGEGKPRLIVVPLLGHDSTAKNHWMDGQPVRILSYKIPADPVHDRWPVEVLNQSLHVIHNFWPIPARHGKGMDILTASAEGVSLLSHESGHWQIQRIGSGDQSHPNGSRGSSEVKMGKLKNGRPVIATIEPFHGNQVVVYTPPAEPGKLWQRHVIDNHLKWGHGVWWADLDGDGNDELIVGVRDDLSQKPGERRGVRIYKALDDKGTRWARYIVDNGGVAVEDITAADLNGDGRPDLVAVGRQTGNIRIYWNEGR
jgi:hypothetical protein